MTGKDIFKLKKAGVSDKTIQLIVKEKVIETAAFSVNDIVSMKKAGVTEKTLRILIEEGSFLANSEPIVYGRETQSIRHISAQDVINLKNNGVSDLFGVGVNNGWSFPSWSEIKSAGYLAPKKGKF